MLCGVAGNESSIIDLSVSDMLLYVWPIRSFYLHQWSTLGP